MHYISLSSAYPTQCGLFARSAQLCYLLILVATTCCHLQISAQENDNQKTPTEATIPPEELLLVLGSTGAPEFEEDFLEAVQNWESLAEQADWKLTQIHVAQNDLQPRELLKNSIDAHQSPSRLWVVFLGHGTFSRGVAKFNLVGPDVSAKELKQWLKDVPSQVVLLNCTSASAPFLTEVAGTNRIVVSGTKSGAEYNYARFGKYFAQAANDAKNDLDHDREVSLLEAFLAASNLVERFYAQEGRLATEHALLNDNGDKAGTSADFYRGIRPAKESQSGQIDGPKSSRIILLSTPEAVAFPKTLEADRTKIEAEIDKLRSRKMLIPREAYWNQLEILLLELTELYDRAEEANPMQVDHVQEEPAEASGR